MAKTVARRVEQTLDLGALKRQVTELAGLKNQLTLMTKRQNELKKRLSAAVEEFGEEDDKGHLRLDLGEPVEGVSELQRQRRVSQGFDEDKAEHIVESLGLRDRCYQTIEVLNEDEVLAAHYEGLISEEQIDEMYPKSISYAFITR